jgi:hypothetical protein
VTVTTCSGAGIYFLANIEVGVLRIRAYSVHIYNNSDNENGNIFYIKTKEISIEF